jgi:hypothetical protein
MKYQKIPQKVYTTMKNKKKEKKQIHRKLFIRENKDKHAILKSLKK